MDSPPSPTYARNVSYNSGYTETRSNSPHSFSDAYGARPNSLVEDQQQRTLKGHTDEHKPAPEFTDVAGDRVTSYHDEPGYMINRSLGQVSVNQERAKPLSVGDMAAGNRPKSEYDNDSTYVHVKPPSQGEVREFNPSYEDNKKYDDDDDDDVYQAPAPISLNGEYYGRNL